VVNATDSTNRSDTDLQEAATRHDSALAIIRPLADALDLIPALFGEIHLLRYRLASVLNDLRNLTAAARATLSAHADGEQDPLYYLRDELGAQGHLNSRGRPPTQPSWRTTRPKRSSTPTRSPVADARSP
jgi:hypothetical protein